MSNSQTQGYLLGAGRPRNVKNDVPVLVKIGNCQSGMFTTKDIVAVLPLDPEYYQQIAIRSLTFDEVNKTVDRESDLDVFQMRSGVTFYRSIEFENESSSQWIT